jgi:hypothetical protein
MDGGRKARIPRIAGGTSSQATLRTKNTVRLVEVLYPLPKDPKPDLLFRREIRNKWIYIFHQTGMTGSAKLVEEVYADSQAESWTRMAQAGKGKDREAANAAVPYPYPKGYAGVPDEQGQYAYYLSPIQLGPKTVDDLGQKVQGIHADGDRWNPSNLDPIPIDGVEYAYYLTSGFSEIDQPVCLHSYSKRQANRLYVVLLPDPFAWAEDIHLLGFQGAMAILDKYRPESRMKGLIAQAFEGLVKVDNDTLDLANEFPDLPTFWNKTKPPQFHLYRQHPDDSMRRLTHIQKVDATKWASLPGSVQNVPALQVKICEVEDEMLRDLAYDFAEEWAKWVKAPRHKIAEKGCLEMDGEHLELGIIHTAKITFRLGEVAPGEKLLTKEHGQAGTILHELLETKETQEGAAGVWEKYAAPREVTLSMFKVIENCLGVIAVVEDKNFQKAVKSLLGAKYLKFEWKPPDPKKLPKFWGKIMPTSLKTPQLHVPDKGVLKDSKELFEKYKISQWFKLTDLSLKSISICFTLHKVMSEKTTAAEKAKAALDSVSFVADVNEFRFKVRFGEKAELEGFSKGLAKVGQFAGIITGFVDFYVTASAFGKSWCMDQNYAVAAVEVAAGVGIGVGITASAFGLIFGEAVSGPVGWIALAVTLLGLLTAWLIRKFTRNKFEEVACYSFLGLQHVRGRSEQERRFYLGAFGGCSASNFGGNLKEQWRAITGLLSAFKFDAPRLDALAGTITVTPGWVQRETVFHFKWQFQFSGGEAVVIVASLKVADPDDWDPKVTTSQFPTATDVSVEWYWGMEKEEGNSEDDMPVVKSFTIGPRMKETRYRTHLTPYVTTVLVQADVFGDGTLILPFTDEDSEVEVDSGPIAGKHRGWVMYRVTGTGQEAHVAVPVGL